MLTKIVIFVILIVLIYIFHLKKEKILNDFWDLYRPKWFADCRFCIGFWLGFIYGLLHFINIIW